jgi:hypothetical protein
MRRAAGPLAQPDHGIVGPRPVDISKRQDAEAGQNLRAIVT